MHFTATSIPLHLPLYVSAVDPQPTSSPSSICLTASHIFLLQLILGREQNSILLQGWIFSSNGVFIPWLQPYHFLPTKEVRTDRGIQIAIGFYVLEEQVVIYSYLLFRPDGNQKAHLVG